MKIRFLIGNISACGGTERVTSELASAFCRSGYDVGILSLFSEANTYFPLEKKVKVTGLSLSEAQGKLSSYYTISRQILNYVHNEKPDVIILVDTILFAFCLPWSFFVPTKIICWEHFNLTTDHGSKFRTLARYTASKFSDGIVVLTDRDEKQWIDKYRIYDRVKSIWNPVPQFEKRDFTKDPNEKKVVVAVGRLTDQKGFDILLKAWALIFEKNDSWVLRIVGGGENESSLKKLARKLHVDNSVIFVGQSNNVQKEYQRAEIYVMSSRWEGLPMTLLEAQYFGLPSVSTDCKTGPKEVLECGSGILVPTENSKELANALDLLMNDTNKREVMSRIAIENAIKYNVDGVVKEWNKLFRKIGNS